MLRISKGRDTKVIVKVTLRLAVRFGDRPLESHGQYFFQLNTCGHSPYVTSSLTRELVCGLQFLLALPSAVILGSESRGTQEHILLSQVRDSSNLDDHVPPYLYPPGTGEPSYAPGTGFPLRRLLRLTGLRLRYSTPPPHGSLREFTGASKRQAAHWPYGVQPRLADS
jgi:hypothetical protein